jgi:hypothetical protein
MNSFEDESIGVASPGAISKRAARRLIQRAFVLTERDRHVRQQIREVGVITLWEIADWGFEWTVHVDHGRIEFDRRASKRPGLILTWKTAEDFFRQATSNLWTEDSFERQGDAAAWRSAGPVVRGFFQMLDSVLRNPVDENGVRLV